MRVGVVGCGHWGLKHVRVLSQSPSVASVVAVEGDDHKRAALRGIFPGITAFATLSECLEQVDAVIVATPPSSHASIALEALNAGKHVLVEKPITTSAADARMLVKVAAASGLTLMAGHTYIYNDALRMLSEHIRRGDLGSLFYIDSARLNLGLYQDDVNVVWDLAPHDISILNFLLDSTPTAVQCWASNHAHSRGTRQTLDVAYLLLDYQELGVMAHVHVSWLDPCKVRRLTVVGSEKMAVYNDLADEGRLRVYNKGVTTRTRQSSSQPAVSYRYGEIHAPFVDMREPLDEEDGHFLHCIRTGETPLSSGESGLAVVEVLEAIQEASETRMPVPVDGHRQASAHRG